MLLSPSSVSPAGGEQDKPTLPPVSPPLMGRAQNPRGVWAPGTPKPSPCHPSTGRDTFHCPWLLQPSLGHFQGCWLCSQDFNFYLAKEENRTEFGEAFLQNIPSPGRKLTGRSPRCASAAPTQTAGVCSSQRLYSLQTPPKSPDPSCFPCSHSFSWAPSRVRELRDLRRADGAGG